VTTLSSPNGRSTGLARQFALALALASGTAILAVPGFTDAAHAQRTKKDDKKKEASKSTYSKEFIASYQPLDEALKAPDANFAELKPRMLAMVPLAVSPEEQQALGGMLFNAAILGKDLPMQMQGVEMMLNSGNIQPADQGRFNLVAFQIASNLNQYEKARTYLQRAIDLNYTSENVSMADLQMNLVETYFSEDRYAEGLAFLSAAIAQRKEQALPVDERWYKRGVAIAYTNEVVPQVYDFVSDWVGDYPTAENWRDGVNLTRNLNDFDPQVLLDLLRLGRKVGTLTEKNDYIYYIEAADPRRLPLEVKELIDSAYSSGIIPKGSDTFVDEQYRIASGRIAADRADLPALERDAGAASAQMRTVLAAGDAFLNYGEYAKAVRFYEKSLSLPGVDRNLALTRLGIAQIAMGDAAAASQNLAKVEGVRIPVARLWGSYAAQLLKDSAAPQDVAPKAVWQQRPRPRSADHSGNTP
jgi:tetratricopeptide (TPR) repeat protein